MYQKVCIDSGWQDNFDDENLGRCRKADEQVKQGMY